MDVEKYNSFKLKGQKIVKNSNSLTLKSNSSRNRKTRLRTGCFCCRKRRIKCQGQKPSCKNCDRSSYLCIWPHGEESLSHDTDFKLTKINKSKQDSVQFVSVDIKSQNNNLILTTYKPKNKNEINKKFTSFDIINNLNNMNSINIEENFDKMMSGNFHDSYPNNKGNTNLSMSINMGINEFSNDDKDLLFKNSGKEGFNENTDLIQDVLYRRFLVQLNYSVADNLLSTKWDQSSILYNAFVNGFMTNISPQLTHFKLQPCSAFIPYGVDNNIIRDLFASCGATFLYSTTNNIEMKEIAQSQLYKSSNNLINFINGIDDIRGNEGWITVYLLLTYLKIRYDLNNRRTKTLNMIAVTEVVKLWIFNNKSQNLEKDPTAKIQELEKYDNENYNLGNGYSKINGNGMSINLIQHNFENITTKFKQILQEKNINNTMKHKDKTLITESTICSVLDNDTSSTIEAVDIFPYERTMLESFIYNYSNSLFVCDKSLLSKMTSPFLIFEMLRPYLSVPIYKCAVPWMNHPVAGAAFPSFELQAKVCWIGLHLPLSAQHRNLLETLRNNAKYYIKPILPPEVHKNEPPSVKRKLMESCYAAEIISKAVFIYSTKLLYPNVNIEDNIIQDAVEEAYKSLCKITMQSPIHGTLAFAFVIIGTVAILPKHREYFLWKLGKLKKVLQIHMFHVIEEICRNTWSDMTVHQQPNSWELLFQLLAM